MRMLERLGTTRSSGAWLVQEYARDLGHLDNVVEFANGQLG
jgi:hypothetical protein